jgi:mannitol/fructose-specific phosphotransferase system IIA component (Ntr-type)
MTLGYFTAADLLIPQLSGVDQASAINELSQRLQQAGRIEDSLTFFQAVLQCDYLSSSATEDGVAFLHARVRGIDQPCFAAGFSKAGVRWRDGSPVHAVFLMAVPPDETQLYLALMSALSRLSQTTQLMSSLMTCQQGKEVLNLLNTVELSAPAHRGERLAQKARKD